MLAMLETLLKMVKKRTADMDMIDRAIDNLHQSDEELEWRLRRLRDQVDVYQRTHAESEYPLHEQPHE
jgi:hypothetical protein